MSFVARETYVTSVTEFGDVDEGVILARDCVAPTTKDGVAGGVVFVKKKVY